MTDPNRRQFLLTAGSALAAGALSSDDLSSAAEIAQIARQSIPPHRSLTAPGVHVYTDRPSYAAGET
ncbi:MAG TPA: hypothetical protein VHB99_18690, partial [Pirellulales bacterium]|nr:hypothetical protein [Pirellulales bacterium]